VVLKGKNLSLIKGVNHAFGTMSEPIPSEFLLQWPEAPIKRQVHGVLIAVLSTKSQNCGEVDGLFTGHPGLLVPILSGDCVPVLMARQDGQAVAGYHAGWRGTLSGMASQLASFLKNENQDLKEWVACVGPAIGPCCYEISPEIAERFLKTFLHIDATRFLPRPRYLDIGAINESELHRLGFGEVERIPICTMCSVAYDPQKSPLFNSYRRQGPGHLQYSVISRIKETPS
jgi:YfiH family protein